MEDLDSVINNSKLPDQLKEYLKKSVRIKRILKVDMINDIEDIYIFYDSLYTFDSSEFSSYVVISLSKCTNLDAFYHYLKKVIDTSLERESRGKEIPDSHRFIINSNVIEKVFVEVFM